MENIIIQPGISLPMTNEGGVPMTKLKCDFCGEKAYFTKRKTKSSNEKILVGGNDIYLPICDNCC